MILAMLKKGLFGEPYYTECSYVHDIKTSGSGKSRFIEADQTLSWRGRLMAEGRGSSYPAHGIAPVAKWLGINDGDRFEYCNAMMSRPREIHAQVVKQFGADSAAAKINFQTGDFHSTLIHTVKGKMIRLDYSLSNNKQSSIYEMQMLKTTWLLFIVCLFGSLPHFAATSMANDDLASHVIGLCYRDGTSSMVLEEILKTDGKIEWQHPFGGTMHGLMTYRKGVLYEHGYPSIVRAINVKTGKELWSFDAKNLHDSVETFWTAPLFIGNRILIPTADGPGRNYNRQKFFVLDPNNGQKLGQFEFDAPGSSCGVPRASAGIVIFHDNIHSRWTAVKVGEGENTDWYPFRGDDSHSGAPSHQDKKDSSGSFRIGEIAIYTGEARPKANPPE